MSTVSSPSPSNVRDLSYVLGDLELNSTLDPNVRAVMNKFALHGAPQVGIVPREAVLAGGGASAVLRELGMLHGIAANNAIDATRVLKKASEKITALTRISEDYNRCLALSRDVKDCEKKGVILRKMHESVVNFVYSVLQDFGFEELSIDDLRGMDINDIAALLDALLITINKALTTRMYASTVSVILSTTKLVSDTVQPTYPFSPGYIAQQQQQQQPTQQGQPPQQGQQSQAQVVSSNVFKRLFGG